MNLTRVLYFSENVMDASNGSVIAGLSSILSASNRNNKARGITGALIFDNHWFLQCLEGDRTAVWETLKRIEDDERHAGVVIVDARHAEERLFGNWWMGLATRSEQTADVFAPHLRNGLLQPQDMTAENVLDLMSELCKAGLSRKLAAT